MDQSYPTRFFGKVNVNVDSTQQLVSTPKLNRLVECISQMSPFQKKSIERTLASADDAYFVFAEDWVGRLLEANGQGDEEGYERLAQAYVAYTKMIRVEEMHFLKDRDYRHKDYDEVYQRVYSQDEHMWGYVLGLGLTQLFWANHYRIVRFFLDDFVPRITSAKRGAEIGVGHGLFHSEMLRGAPSLTSDMLDISPVSLECARRIIQATGISADRSVPHLCDVHKEIPLEDGSLDVLLMGEIIEHLADAKSVMQTMARKMSAGGICFMTTAANAPAEDHILLFRTTGEIRDFTSDCGWEIVSERIDTLGEMTVEEAEAGGHNLNYSAIIRPARLT